MKANVVPIWIFIAIGIVLLILAGLAVFMVALLMRLSARASGWTELAKLYSVEAPPAEQQHAQQTVQIGAIRYRRCVTVGIGPQGLALWVRPSLAKFHPILIPWDEVKAVQEARLYSTKAVQLSIGEPSVATIVVYAKLFEAISPYLAPGL